MMQRSEAQHAGELCCTLLLLASTHIFHENLIKSRVCNSKRKLSLKTHLQTVCDVQCRVLWLNSCNLYWRSLIPAGPALSAGLPCCFHRKEVHCRPSMKGNHTAKDEAIDELLMIEPQKLDFTSKRSHYWQPHPHAWLSHQQNVKWLRWLARLRIPSYGCVFRPSLSLWLGFLSNCKAHRS